MDKAHERARRAAARGEDVTVNVASPTVTVIDLHDAGRVTATRALPKPSAGGKASGKPTNAHSLTTKHVSASASVRRKKTNAISTKRGYPVRAGIADDNLTQPERQAQQQAAFLEAYKTEGTISAACHKAQVGTRTHYDWLERDPTYKSRFRDAHEVVVDEAELELRRRGIVGHDRPVFYQGEICGVVREYSDACLIFYLKGRRPEIFKERFEHTGDQGGPIFVVERVIVDANERARPQDIDVTATMLTSGETPPGS